MPLGVGEKTLGLVLALILPSFVVRDKVLMTLELISVFKCIRIKCDDVYKNI